jgi:hypothetical protein
MTIYCSQLGMVLNISYCFSANEGLPCRNTIGCWQERTDIVAMLNERFTKDEIEKAFSGLPKSRIQRIIESIEGARKKA